MAEQRKTYPAKMSISIKAYLMALNGQEKEEIRRFAIDNDVSTNFLYLQEKLMKIFTALSRGEFSVYWKDEEGDLIVVSSDEELMSALTSTKGDLHKLYIKRRSAANGQDNKVHHPRVSCDGCNGAVNGYRYKCLECPDYDLCSKCEVAGIHSEHVMMRLSKPVDKHNPSSIFPWLFARHFGRRGRHGHHGASFGCPRKSHRHHGGAGQEDGGAGEAGASSAPNAYPFQFQQVLEKIWTVLGGLPKDKDASESGTEGSSDEKGGERPTPAPEQQKEEFLKRVGETVAQFLDPLGIDVDIGVEHNGRYQNVSKPNSSKQTPTSPPPCATGGSSAPSDPAQACLAAAYARQQSGGVDHNASADHSQFRSNTNTMPESEAAKRYEAAKAQSKVESRPAAVPTPDKTVQMLPTPSAELLGATGKQTPDRASPTLSGHEEASDWTYIDDKEKAQIPAILKFPSVYPEVPPLPAAAEQGGVRPRTSAGPPTTSLAEEMRLLSEEVQHPDPLIRSALSHMTSMGFSNEGGWLTQLLEVKRGNIDSVLEVLAPQKPM